MREDIERRMELEQFLLPDSDRLSMDSPTHKGFSLLVDILHGSDSWERGRVPGEISFRYSPDYNQMDKCLETYLGEYLRDHFTAIQGKFQKLPEVIISLNLRHTLARNFLDGADRHLDVITYSEDTMRSMDVCITSRRDASHMPITDDCCSFVLWALAGFPEPSRYILQPVLYVIDEKAYEEYEEARKAQIRSRREKLLQAEYIRQDELDRIRQFEDQLKTTISRLESMPWDELVLEYENMGAPKNELEYRVHRYIEELIFPGLDIQA